MPGASRTTFWSIEDVPREPLAPPGASMTLIPDWVELRGGFSTGVLDGILVFVHHRLWKSGLRMVWDQRRCFGDMAMVRELVLLLSSMVEREA